MAWEKFKRTDTFQGSDKAFVTIRPGHIAFSAVLSRLAELDDNHRVSIYVDSKNRKIGFEFHTDGRPDSFSMSRASGSAPKQKRVGYFCPGQGLVNAHPWIRSVSKLKGIKERRFHPVKQGNKWVIQLCPAFEVKRARESEDIPSDAKGIYRYISGSEVVYIGRGNIRGRLRSPERQDWQFDIVEYSIVEDPDEQIKWEAYWLEKYKEDHDGKLPAFNSVSGASSSA